LRRFFISELLTPTITIQGQDARHIGQVLRLEPGDELVVVGSDGQAGRFHIRTIKATSVEAVMLETIDVLTEPPIKVFLAQGLPKADKMDYIIQKAVELGVSNVIPMDVRFSTVNYDETKKKTRVERWQKISREAAKQCGRGTVPEVTQIKSLAEVFDAVGPDTVSIMLYEGETKQGFKEIMTTTSKAKSYLILIGPEGGFSLDEVEFCLQHRAHICTLGPRILRTETAALATLSIIMYQNGDLG